MSAEGAILERFPDARLLGEGSESRVYALSDSLVLRIPKGGSPRFWERRRTLCELVGQVDLGFRTPQVLESGDVDGTAYIVEVRIGGRNLTEVLPVLTGAARRRALDCYFDAVFALGAVSLDVDFYGELLADDPQRAPTWSQFLASRVRASVAAAPAHVRDDLPELDHVADVFYADTASLDVSSRQLVHGDYFPGNVLVDEVGTVTGVVDFANLTMAGDPALDVAGALAFLSITPGIDAGDVSHVHQRANRMVPRSMHPYEAYERFYAFRYLHTRDGDPELYSWCLSILRGPTS